MYNNSLVRVLAEKAIRDMADSMVECYADEDKNISLGDHTDSIRDMAADYAGDMIDELRFEVLKMIETMKFSSKVEMNVQFSD
jgi:hypothetical protein